MSPENRHLFLTHALTQSPRESCGVLIIEGGRETLVVCRNLAEQNNQFILDPKDYASASKRGEIVGVVHSHCFIPPEPSDADRVGCEASGLPWYILSVPQGAWCEIRPCGYKAPLIGRQWSHGTLDCFGLVRDYYRETLGVEIPDFEREPEWWERGQNLYCDSNLELAGFYEVHLNELRERDVLLMQIHSRVINHAGVYLGNDTFLHHLNGRLSSRDCFAGYWRKHTVKVLRYGAGANENNQAIW